MAIAAAPMLGGVPQATSAQKPAPPAAQKPAAADAKKPAADAKGVRTIDLVGTEDMKFNLTSIAAKRGEQIRVRLTAKGAMPKIAMAHNFVLLDKAANVVNFVTAAAQARATDFVPAGSKEVLAHTPLAGAGETVEITFKVPATAGDYPYICSFPGHFQVGMKGMLNVK